MIGLSGFWPEGLPWPSADAATSHEPGHAVFRADVARGARTAIGMSVTVVMNGFHFLQEAFIGLSAWSFGSRPCDIIARTGNLKGVGQLSNVELGPQLILISAYRSAGPPRVCSWLFL